jgi:hypothetical protein
MPQWQDELFSLALLAGTEQEIFNQIALEAQRMGFEYCAYGMQVPVPVSSPKVMMINNYPQAWRQQYSKSQ